MDTYTQEESDRIALERLQKSLALRQQAAADYDRAVWRLIYITLAVVAVVVIFWLTPSAAAEEAYQSFAVEQVAR